MVVIWSGLKLQELSDAFFASSSFFYSVLFVCSFVFCILENYGWIFSHFFLEKKSARIFTSQEKRNYTWRSNFIEPQIILLADFCVV